MSPLLLDPVATTVGAWLALQRLGPALGAAALLLLLPGLAAALLIQARGELDGAADAAAAAPGIGMLGVALGWWAAELTGAPLQAPLLVSAVVLSGLVAAAILVRRRSRPSAALAWLLVLGALALVTRLAVVRELALPAWVDAVHHTYLTAQLAERGGVPATYGPLLGFGPFAYHFGFHALAASSAIAVVAAPPDAVLAAGQLLSAMAVPASFLLARLYGASRLGALAAGAAGGLVSMMPAYYVSWSRFTEQAGLVAAPVCLLLARRAGRSPADAGMAGLAGAAMLLVHPRVAVMVGLLIVVDFLIRPEGWRSRRWLPLAPIAAGLIVLPWLGRLFGGLLPRLGVPVEGIETANALDLTALSTHQDPWFYGLAVAAAVAGLTAGSFGAWVAVAWLALVFAAANPGMLGLPGTYWLSNGAVVIALWLPAAALVGGGIGAAASTLAERAPERSRRWGARLAPVAIVLLAALFSGGPMAALNPTTVLATERDRRFLEGLGAVLPTDALVAVNAREWQLRTYTGSDGGYWIGVITPGRAIVPPLLYGLGPPDQARATSERLARWQAGGGDPRALAAQMREMGASWLFVGERGGSIEADRLTPADGFELVLADGPVRLYRLREEPSP